MADPRPRFAARLWATPTIGLTAGWAVLAAALLAALYYRAAIAFWPRWANEEAYQHCMLVPPIVAGLVWYHRAQLASLKPRPTAVGLLLLGLGLAVCYLGYLTGARFVVGLSFPLVLLGLIASVLGPDYLRVLVFPVLLFVFAVPFPRHIMGLLSMPMQLVSSALTAACTRLLGIPIQHEGVNIALPSFRFTVAEECSGMNSLLALFLACGVIAEVASLSVWQKLVTYVLVPVVVLTANVIRLMSVVLLGEFVGSQFALNHFVHGGSDVVVYLAAFALMWGWVSFLKGVTQRVSDDEVGPVAESV